MATIDTSHPMGAARYVRRERYAWPGGYALALVTVDGGALCPQCVAENFASVSHAHRNRVDDGWKPDHVASGADTDGPIDCDHCGRVIIGGDASGAAE